MKVALVEGVDVEDLALDFTVPGYDIELRVRRFHCPISLSYSLYRSM